jgi:hypothetical protein
MTVMRSVADRRVAENDLHSVLLRVTSDACADMLALDAVVKAG